MGPHYGVSNLIVLKFYTSTCQNFLGLFRNDLTSIPGRLKISYQSSQLADHTDLTVTSVSSSETRRKDLHLRPQLSHPDTTRISFGQLEVLYSQIKVAIFQPCEKRPSNIPRVGRPSCGQSVLKSQGTLTARCCKLELRRMFSGRSRE